MKITMKPGELMDVTCHGADGYIALVCEGNIIRVVVEGSLRDFPVHAEELAIPTRHPIHPLYMEIEMWMTGDHNVYTLLSLIGSLKQDQNINKYYKMKTLFLMMLDVTTCKSREPERLTQALHFMNQALMASRDCPYWEEK
jgi:hypothetical protein